MYKYELHCHTAKVSARSRMGAEELVELYLENGYDGIFVTDHFLNGNTTVDRRLPYEEEIEAFCRGYEEVKAAAGVFRIRVFLSRYGRALLRLGQGEAESSAADHADEHARILRFLPRQRRARRAGASLPRGFLYRSYPPVSQRGGRRGVQRQPHAPL